MLNTERKNDKHRERKVQGKQLRLRDRQKQGQKETAFRLKIGTLTQIKDGHSYEKCVEHWKNSN